MVEQIQFAALGKLSMPSMEGEEVRSCGSVQYYDKAFDRVVPKNERPLKRTQRVFRSVTTSDDPVIRCGPSCSITSELSSIIMAWFLFPSLPCHAKHGRHDTRPGLQGQVFLQHQSGQCL